MNQSVKTVTLLIGTLLGAALGFKIASTFIEESENDDNKLPITATQGLQLGLTALGMLKQVNGISKTKV